LYNPDKRGEEEKKSAQYTLYYLLNGILKLFAPIMPFITEELYLASFADIEKVESIHVSKWPKYDKKLDDPISEKIWDNFIAVLTEVRQTKAKYSKSLKTEIDLVLKKEDESLLRSSIEDLKAVTCAKSVDSGTKLKILF